MINSSRRQFLKGAAKTAMLYVVAPMALFRNAQAQPALKSSCPSLNECNGNKKDATRAIQAIIDAATRNGSQRVQLPSGKFTINPDIGITLPSNLTLEMMPDTYLIASATSSKKYALLKIHGVRNVAVSGGSIVGDRTSHLGTGGEWGFGISVRGSDNVKLSNLKVSDCWGDGIYVGAYPVKGTQIPSSNIHITHVTCTDNRRQGLSIVACIGGVVSDSTFSDTRGTAPESGIDLEPNPGQKVENIQISNCRMENNAGSGIIFSRRSSQSTVEKSFINKNRKYGVRLSGASNITATNNQITGNTGYDVFIDDKSRSYNMKSNTLTKSTSLLGEKNRMYIMNKH